MLTLTILSLLSILPSMLIALKCHQVATANLASPPETQPTECIAGSLACVKLIDYTSKTFSKQCQQFNCTVSFLTENKTSSDSSNISDVINAGSHGDSEHQKTTVAPFRNDGEQGRSH
ncbi:unnamed protein product [Angiostrongylus costaricensis]|uniref:Secreted protein n=1 Tax=Angiostrongylus costaricensis TaxID=334426 RepID=A0A0R3P9I5_ANGCS|nr:unnamed protein product [Angiostrongylus costaricensis]